MTWLADAVHQEIYREQGAFAGWPANYGLWCWGEEIVACFVVGKLGVDSENLHLEDRDHPFEPVQSRSLDGGVTWNAEAFRGHVPGGNSLSADEHLQPGNKADEKLEPSRDLKVLPAPIDFTDPETIVLAARTGITGSPQSWFYKSHDRGYSWDGPFAFVGLGRGLSARTDIVTLGPHDALFFLTATKRDGTEGRVICARTTDGGMSFKETGVVCDSPDGYAIMPSSALLRDGTVYTVVRRGGQDRNALEAYYSTDTGQTWRHSGTPVENTGYMGNPPALVLLPSGKLVLVFGFRDLPFGIRFVMSLDHGHSWSAPYTLRCDGGEPDLGYPRAVVRPDGKIVAVYYFNDPKGRERYISASIFGVD
ncbi:sialidase family protein [Pararhizobium arenae]|uniref:sialidase family protein n=1 Tax=Pararhizobium arenae TaxID=1856850 RepID=UPI00094B6309|nr:sialidase family protein [Pararhizobium arenae]